MDRPLVSVIIITYNSQDYVIETLESVLSQTYDNVELIIADDASADNTVELCSDWVKRNNERFKSVKLTVSDINQGTPSNCNRGVKASNGTWIKILAGDDALYPEMITEYVEYSQSHPDAKFLHGKYHIYKDEFNHENKLPDLPFDRILLNQKENSAGKQFQILLRSYTAAVATHMIHKEVFNKIGYFDEKLRLWEDRPFLLKMTKAGIKMHFVNTFGAKYRRHSNSVMRNKKKRVVSDFELELSKTYLERYIHYLPIHEKIIKWITYKRKMVIGTFYSNHKIVKFLLKLTAYPWKTIDELLVRKYIYV